MLVLSRRVGESVVIEVNGEELTLTALDVHGNSGNYRIKLGFDGPEDFEIIRMELRRPEPQAVGTEPAALTPTESVEAKALARVSNDAPFPPPHVKLQPEDDEAILRQAGETGDPPLHAVEEAMDRRENVERLAGKDSIVRALAHRANKVASHAEAAKVYGDMAAAEGTGLITEKEHKEIMSVLAARMAELVKAEQPAKLDGQENEQRFNFMAFTTRADAVASQNDAATVLTDADTAAAAGDITGEQHDHVRALVTNRLGYITPAAP